jgi:hypothetical protein
MFRFAVFLTTLLPLTSVFAQTSWEIPEREFEILLDGFLDEWEGVPSRLLAPDRPGVKSAGSFGEADLSVKVMAVWDEERLYLALYWQDDVWDIQKVSRREAVWIDADDTRHDRMYFFDNFKFHIRKSDYDYTMWVSPRANDEGPHFWCRLLEGYGGMERATATPMITFRNQGGHATAELELSWEQLRLEPKEKEPIPIRLVVADADLPGKSLETKLSHRKWVGWMGQFVVLEADD